MQTTTITTDLLQQLQAQVAELKEKLASLEEIKVEIMMADQLERHNLTEKVSQKARSYVPAGLGDSLAIPENFVFQVTPDDVLQALLQTYQLQK